MRKIPSSANLKSSASTSRGACAPYPHGHEEIRRSVSSSSLGSMIKNEKSESPVSAAAVASKQVRKLHVDLPKLRTIPYSLHAMRSTKFHLNLEQIRKEQVGKLHL